jgi:hypothetical protein
MSTAVVAAALFVACSAVFAVTFVAGRGGLQLPVASVSAPPVAVASEEPLETEEPEPTPTLAPPATLGPPGPTEPAATTVPTPLPTEPAPSVPAPTVDPNDPLAALPGCPGHPGCFRYVVQRGDTFTGVVSRYRLSVVTILALNPELKDPSVIAVGRTLYLGRDPWVRLDPCPNGEACSLYVVVSGDSLTRIASRYDTSVNAIKALNPGLSTPIHPGDVIKVPRPT